MRPVSTLLAVAVFLIGAETQAKECTFDEATFAAKPMEEQFNYVFESIAAGCETKELSNEAFDLVSYGENCKSFFNVMLENSGLKPLKCNRLKGPPEPVMTPTKDLQREIVDAHNHVRQNVQPAASPALKPLKWSKSLARSSQKWADKLKKSNNCSMEHSAHKPGTDPIGENLFWNSGLPQSWTTAVNAWADEVKDFQYGCGKTGVVGHYTQVVWDDTREVGCGWASCGREAGHVYVCQYKPAGNWVNREYEPYATKAPPTCR